MTDQFDEMARRTWLECNARRHAKPSPCDSCVASALRKVHEESFASWLNTEQINLSETNRKMALLQEVAKAADVHMTGSNTVQGDLDAVEALEAAIKAAKEGGAL